MNPTPGDVHVNSLLTNVSIAYAQSQSNFVSADVFPIVPVAKQSDRYAVWNRGDFNRDEMKKRGPATESAGGGFRVDTTPTYFADVWAFHKDIDDQTRANADSQFGLDSATTKYVTTKALIRREKLFVSKYFGTGIWGTDVTGVAAAPGASQFLQWNDGASSPIETIRSAKRVMLESTGYEPNTLTIGQAVWDALVDHPDVVDRIKYGQTPGKPAIVTREAVAMLLEIDRVFVMKAVENTAKEGATAVHSFIGGKKALLSYAAPEPQMEMPSAGYTFAWTGYLGATPDGTRIKRFRRAEEFASDRVEIEMAIDPKLVAPELGYFFDSAVA